MTLEVSKIFSSPMKCLEAALDDSDDVGARVLAIRLLAPGSRYVWSSGRPPTKYRTEATSPSMELNIVL